MSSSATTSRRCWWLEQDYVGPDGVARTRGGLVCALRVEPYSAGVVLPHERTHAGPKEGRLRLLRALRAHVEPLFFLYDGALEGRAARRSSTSSSRASATASGGSRASRRPRSPTRSSLIADGHHRYETALAFHEEDGTRGERLAAGRRSCPTEQEGLTIFPTHRLADDVDVVAAPSRSDESRSSCSAAATGRSSTARGRELRARPDGVASSTRPRSSR